jgi:NhaP-type Na+/H+ or K+/H+ antiporter
MGVILFTPLVYLTTVFVLGIASQWVAWRLRLPAIVVLLAAGFGLGQAIGPETAAMIPRRLLFPGVSLAVAVILFEGGLSLRLRDLNQTRHAVIRLCTLGVFFCWIPMTFAAKLVFESWEVSALVGALFVVTGPTVITPLLRYIRPKSRVGSVAKWEGIVNDPIGAILAVLVFESSIHHGSDAIVSGMLVGVLKTSLITLAIGGLTAGLIVKLLKRHWIPDFLENPVLLGLVLLAFTVSNVLQKESGLATVTLLGIVLANQKSVRIHHVLEFKENLVVLLISVLFIVLGSRLGIDDLKNLGWEAIAFLAIMILAIRPFSTIASTIGTSMTWNEKLFISGLAPRGIVAAAVASVFALEIGQLTETASPEILRDAEKLTPVTFLVIFGTVTVYGLGTPFLARRLKISDPNPQGILFAGADRFVRDLALAVQKEGFSVLLVDTNYENISAARMNGLPTQTASIISEYATNELDLGGIGKLFAMTPNDEVNSLAVRQFADQFGRVNLFQLTPRSAEEQKPRGSLSDRLTGRNLFAKGLTYPKLSERCARGSRLKKTLLTEEFTYEDFQRLYGESALVLLVIDEQRKSIKTRTPDEEFTPKSGQTLISLVDVPADGSLSDSRIDIRSEVL